MTEPAPIPGGVPATVPELLAQAAARHPGRPAMVDCHRSWTFAELAAATDRTAVALRALGARPGRAVAVSLPNDGQIALAFLACLRLGAVWVGVNRSLSVPEKLRILTDSEASVFVGEPGPAAAVGSKLGGQSHHGGPEIVGVDPRAAAGDDVELWRAAGLRSGDLANTPDFDVGTAAPPAARPHQLAAIAYTSGTGGVPKGVMHSHRNLIVPGAAAGPAGYAGPDARVGACLALTVVNLMVLTVLTTLQYGAVTVVIDRTDPEGLADAVRRHRVTSMSAVPTIYHDLVNSAVERDDLDALALPGVGGAACPEDLRAAFAERFGRELLNGYGLTEAPTSVARERSGTAHVPGGSGPALPHVRIEIHDADGRPLPEGAEGEICVGPSRRGVWHDVYTPMLGYRGRPDLTAAALRDGLLHTGDRGVLDDAGNLIVLGRMGEVIVRGGAKIYPEEVEAALSVDERVEACAVVGVPDERLGQRVAAFVQLRPGRGASADELRSACAARLARYKVPEIVEVVPELPRNTMGKVERAVLARRARALSP